MLFHVSKKGYYSILACLASTVFLALIMVPEAEAGIGDWLKDKVGEAVEEKAKEALQETGDVPNDAQVAEAQALLNELGYDVGPANGELGPSTAQAIVQYQTTQGLPPTGAVNSGLLESLNQSVDSKSQASATSTNTPISHGAPSQQAGKPLLSATGVGVSNAAPSSGGFAVKQFAPGDENFLPIEAATYGDSLLLANDYSVKQRDAASQYLYFLAAAMGVDANAIAPDRSTLLPVYEKFMGQERKERYFTCWSAERCAWKGYQRGGASNEFEIARSKEAFREEMVRPIIERGKALPRAVLIKGRSYLGPYDMDNRHFRFDLDPKYGFSLHGMSPVSGLPNHLNLEGRVIPATLPMSPEAAEAFINKLENRNYFWTLEGSITGLQDQSFTYTADTVSLYADDQLTIKVMDIRLPTVAEQNQALQAAQAEKNAQEQAKKDQLATIFPGHRQVIGHLARAGLTAEMLDMNRGFFGRIDEFERRAKISEFQAKLDDAASLPPLDETRVRLQLTLGEYDFDRGGFPISKVQAYFFVGEYAPEFNFPNFVPGLAIENRELLEFLPVEESVARTIVKDYGRSFNAVATVRIGGTRLLVDESRIQRQGIYRRPHGLYYALDGRIRNVELLNKNVRFNQFQTEYKGQSDQVFMTIGGG